MKRRTFLSGALAVVSSRPIPSFAQVQPTVRLASVVITDVSSGIPIKKLLALTDVLWERGVSFTCVVSPPDAGDRKKSEDHELSALLFGLSLRGDGTDVATFIPDLCMRSEYFQSRSARDANEAVRNLIGSNEFSGAMPPSPVTVACRKATQPVSPEGVKSAGVSTVLVLPDENEEVTTEAWPRGVVRVFGGTPIRLADYSGAELRLGGGAQQALYYISANELHEVAADDLVARATAFANDLLHSERSGKIAIQTVSELPLRDDYDYRRYLAIHLVEPDPHYDEELQAFVAFKDKLQASGFSVSTGEKVEFSNPGESRRYWLQSVDPQSSEEPLVGTEKLTIVRRTRSDGLDKALPKTDQILPPGHGLAFGEMDVVTPGYDKCATLWLSCVDIAMPEDVTKLDSLQNKVGSLVVSIRPAVLRDPFAQTFILRRLGYLVGDGITLNASFRDIGKALVPRGAEIHWQRHTVSSLPKIGSKRTQLTATERQSLMEDARVAWSYFAQNTISSTGLCSATSNFSGPSPERLQNVTMWDVGSQINGLVAALELELVSRKEFDWNIGQILDQIQGRSSYGRLLPQGWIRVDRHRIGNKNFDGSDAGRLLSSLKNLKRTPGFGDRVQDLVASWDLNRIVVEGKVHSVTNGKLYSAYRSHSAHYSALAFRHWGVDVKSPYEVFKGRSQYDGQVALLEAASWIGPLGAEPLLLEAMERPISKESAYLADVLFAAQLEEYDETGRLIAVSEGPLDRQPWFTYQGLQLDAERRTWALDTVGGEKQYRTAEFWQDNLVLSSKAAFLWAAYKPHEFSSKLLRSVRRKCRTKHGFASSIYDKTGHATKGYSDLNTNGVILQAIAKLLIGS
uniref:DUF3131 domain-containing protein n=1 Tax=Roseovarius indicus TaxID=540747 RepID=UPI003B528CCF